MSTHESTAGSSRKRGCLVAIARGLLALVVLVGIIAAIAIIAWSRGLVHFPALTGRYAVGRVDYHLIDESRPEIFSETPDDTRELMVTLYYPADVPEGAAPAPITAGALKAAIENKAGVPSFLQDTIRAHSFTDVPLADDSAPYPVLIFSPGMGYIPFFYIPTLEEVASHGYIVAALSHPYSSFVTVFPDGRIVTSLPEAGSRALSEITALATSEDEFAPVVNRIGDVWTADIRFTLDQLALMNAEDTRFAGQLDLAHVGVFGHSMGGGAGIEALHDDDRLIAALNMDGALIGDSAWEGVQRPVMLMLSGEQASLTVDTLVQTGASADNAAFVVERGKTTAQTVFDNAAPGYRLVLAGSKHFTYVTSSALTGPISGAPADAYGTIPVERANQIINTYIVSFFDQYLKGVASPLLNGASADYPEVRFEMHESS